MAPGMPPDNSATGYELWPADAAEEPALSEPEPLKPIVREGWVILPFIGGTFAGWGSMKAKRDCHSGLCDSGTDERGYDQNANAIAGLNGLYHILPALRGGLGLQWMPNVSLDIEHVASANLGAEVASVAILEWIVGGKHAGAVRGFFGAHVLFPHRELQNVIDSHDEQCLKVDEDGGSCQVDAGPYTGIVGGAGVAYIGQLTNEAAVRFEMSLEYLSLSGPSIAIEYDSGTAYSDYLDWSGTRFSLRLGVEF